MSELKKKLIETIEKTPDDVLVQWIGVDRPKTIDNFIYESGMVNLKQNFAISIVDFRDAYCLYTGERISLKEIKSILDDFHNSHNPIRLIKDSSMKLGSGLALVLVQGMRLLGSPYFYTYRNGKWFYDPKPLDEDLNLVTNSKAWDSLMENAGPCNIQYGTRAWASNPIDDFFKEGGATIFDKDMAVYIGSLRDSFQEFSGRPISNRSMKNLLMSSESWKKYELKTILINGNSYISGLRLKYKKGMILKNEGWTEVYGDDISSLVENPEMPIRVID